MGEWRGDFKIKGTGMQSSAENTSFQSKAAWEQVLETAVWEGAGVGQVAGIVLVGRQGGRWAGSGVGGREVVGGRVGK